MKLNKANKTEHEIRFFEKFIFGVAIPNFGLVICTGIYLYAMGYFSEFSKISGSSNSGPGAGTGDTLLAASLAYLTGFVMLVVFLFIPSLIATLVGSIRDWPTRASVFFAGSAICIVATMIYYALTILALSVIRT